MNTPNLYGILCDAFPGEWIHTPSAVIRTEGDLTFRITYDKIKGLPDGYTIWCDKSGVKVHYMDEVPAKIRERILQMAPVNTNYQVWFGNHAEEVLKKYRMDALRWVSNCEGDLAAAKKRLAVIDAIIANQPPASST